MTEKTIKSNIDMLNGIRALASDDYKNRIPVATKENFKKIGETILELPVTKNEFVSVLANVVGKSVFFGKLYTNPYKFFKKGTLDYGTTVESIFVDLIEGKDFSTTAENEVNELIQTKKPTNIKIEYYEQNFQHVYKASISDSRLKGAMRSLDGLSRLVQAQLQSGLSSAERDEFLMMKKGLSKSVTKEKSIALKGSDNENAKKLTKTIKTLIEEFKFMKTEYNHRGVNTFCSPNEVIVFVTPEIKAEIDVELLASSFNMDKADVQARLITIDGFTKENATTKEEEMDLDTVAMVCDENIVQFFETENSSEEFRNARTKTTNVFFHRWGIIGACGYFNGVRIKKLP